MQAWTGVPASLGFSLPFRRVERESPREGETGGLCEVRGAGRGGRLGLTQASSTQSRRRVCGSVVQGGQRDNRAGREGKPPTAQPQRSPRKALERGSRLRVHRASRQGGWDLRMLRGHLRVALTV